MFKVTYTNGTSVLTRHEEQAMALYWNGEGRVDVYLWSDEVQDFCLHADGYDYYGEN